VYKIDSELQRKLQLLKDLFPSPENFDEFASWWNLNKISWANDFYRLILEHRNIGHRWKFSIEEVDILKQYHNANKLIIDYLNSDCYASQSMRKEVESNLLLPVKILRQM
jgi:hypothetical protein